MSTKAKQAIAETIAGLRELGIQTSFTDRDLKELGIEIPEIALSAGQIKSVRRKHKVSQAVFARALNVSTSAVRQWEQGVRRPTGATQVLLDLLTREPALLKYRLPLPTDKPVGRARKNV